MKGKSVYLDSWFIQEDRVVGVPLSGRGKRLLADFSVDQVVEEGECQDTARFFFSL